MSFEQPEQKVSLKEFAVSEIAKARSFENLLETLNQCERRGIEVTFEGAPVAYHEMYNAIDEIDAKYLRGEEISEEDFEKVTPAWGVRDAVMRIINQEALGNV